MAIYTDTKALIASSKRDRDAYGIVTEEIDPISINQFINHSLPPSYFDNLVYAISNIQKKDGKLLTGLGNVKASDADHVAIIADHLLQMDGVTLVVVWEILNNKNVRIAARNSDISFSLKDYLKQEFGSNSGAKLSPDSRGEGGALLNLNLEDWWIRSGTTEAIEKLVGDRMRIWVFDES